MRCFYRTLALLASTFLVVACGDASPPGTDATDTLPPLAPPEVGVQIASTAVTLEAGSEQTLCWSFLTPTDAPLSLIGLEDQIPKVGVHHYAVYTNTEALPAKPVAFDCEQMGPTWGLVSGGGLNTPPVRFPSNTMMQLAGGTHLVLQLHLMNTSSAPLTIDPAYINLEGTSETAGKQPVGLLIAGTLDISIPAHSNDITASGGCAAPEKLENIFAVFPHMHQLGRRHVTTVAPAGGSDAVLSDIQWDFSDQGLYDAKGSAAAGDQVTVTCHYDNPAEKAVNFGLSSKDEMCVSVLYYYPATKMSQYCGF